MRVSRTLTASVAGEIALYAGIGFLGFVVIMLAQNLAQRLPALLAVGFAWGDVLGLLRSLMPLVAAYSVPVGFLFGVLAAVARLSGDAEVTAMRACGLGLGALFGPALALGVLVSATTGLLMVHGEPAARREMRTVLAQVASRGGLLEPGRFRAIGPRVVYVQARDRDDGLLRILVADRSDPERPFLVFAERGRFAFDPETTTLHLELERGDVHFETRSAESHQRIVFERFDYAIDARALFERGGGTRPREMTFAELRETVAAADGGTLSPELVGGRDPNDFRAQLHRRLALPFAPLLFATLGVALGVRRTRTARSWGFLACAVLATAYYTLLTFAEFLGESGRVPAALALWIPNAAFALAAAALLWRGLRGRA
jgi:lipopolysaccharide export system permease protein